MSPRPLHWGRNYWVSLPDELALQCLGLLDMQGLCHVRARSRPRAVPTGRTKSSGDGRCRGLSLSLLARARARPPYRLTPSIMEKGRSSRACERRRMRRSPAAGCAGLQALAPADQAPRALVEGLHPCSRAGPAQASLGSAVPLMPLPSLAQAASERCAAIPPCKVMGLRVAPRASRSCWARPVYWLLHGQRFFRPHSRLRMRSSRHRRRSERHPICIRPCLYDPDRSEARLQSRGVGGPSFHPQRPPAEHGACPFHPMNCTVRGYASHHAPRGCAGASARDLLAATACGACHFCTLRRTQPPSPPPAFTVGAAPLNASHPD